jgi:hypothetical protein
MISRRRRDSNEDSSESEDGTEYASTNNSENDEDREDYVGLENSESNQEKNEENEQSNGEKVNNMHQDTEKPVDSTTIKDVKVVEKKNLKIKRYQKKDPEYVPRSTRFFLHDNRETINSDKKGNHNYKNEDLINAASPTTRSIDETIIKKFYIQLFNY